MGKTKRKWIQLSWEEPGVLRAADIPYDASRSIKTRIDEIASSGGGTYAESIVKDSTTNVVTLVNDLETPGNNQYYGTNSGGIKGFFSIPVGGSTFISFTNSDMVGNIFTAVHNLGTQFVNCMVYDNLNQTLALAPTITLIDNNSLSVDIEPYLPITGTWKVVITTGESDYRTKVTSTDTPEYLAQKTKGSITSDTTSILLVNDSVTPGNTKYYGTNGSGVKGFHDVPAGGPSNTIAGLSNPGGNIDIVGGNCINVTADSTTNIITISANATTSLSFSNTDLSSSTYTFIHNSGHKHTPITIYDNTDKEIIPNEITATDSTSSLIDLTSFAPISGTWRAVASLGSGSAPPTYTVDLTNVATDIRPTVDNNFNIGSSTKKFNSLYVGTVYNNVTTITGTTTLTTAHDIVLCNSSSAFTVNLPACSGVTNKQYKIKNINTGTITVDGNGSETIDGSLTVDLFQYESITIVTNGSNWFII